MLESQKKIQKTKVFQAEVFFMRVRFNNVYKVVAEYAATWSISSPNPEK